MIPLYKDLSLWNAGIKVLANGWGGIALWFVPVLFLGLIIVKCSPKHFKWIYISHILLLGILSCHFQINLPWSITTIPIASFFIFIGRNFSNKIKQMMQTNNYSIIFIICIFSLVGGWWLSTLHKTDLAYNSILPMWVTLGGAILGFSFLLSFSKLILVYFKTPSLILSYIGMHTFPIVAFSQVIILLINDTFPNLNVFIKYSTLFLLLWIIIKIEIIIKRTYQIKCSK